MGYRCHVRIARGRRIPRRRRGAALAEARCSGRVAAHSTDRPLRLRAGLARAQRCDGAAAAAQQTVELACQDGVIVRPRDGDTGDAGPLQSCQREASQIADTRSWAHLLVSKQQLGRAAAFGEPDSRSTAVAADGAGFPTEAAPLSATVGLCEPAPRQGAEHFPPVWFSRSSGGPRVSAANRDDVCLGDHNLEDHADAHGRRAVLG